MAERKRPRSDPESAVKERYCVKIDCVWEHNGDDTLLYAGNLPGAYARGEDVETAARAMYRMAERTFGEKTVENSFRF